jgi:hypothetical protein
MIQPPDYEGHPEAEHFSDEELVAQIEMLIVQSIVTGDDELISLDGKRHLHLRPVKGGVALTIEHAHTPEGTDTTEQIRFEDDLAFGDFDVEVSGEETESKAAAELEEERQRVKEEFGLADGPLERAKLMAIYADMATGQKPED